MTPTSRIEIDLGVLDANLDAWRRTLGDQTAICAVVKADAYGLGAAPIARRLAAGGVRLLAVYAPRQAAELVESGVGAEVLILMPVETIRRGEALYRAAVGGRLHLTVHSAAQLERLDDLGRRLGAALPVHIEVDTGMSRAGMPLEEADRVLEALAVRRGVRLAGLFSHAASADCDPAFTEEQLRRFDGLLRRRAGRVPSSTIIHFAGTYAAMRDRRCHKAMVRLGRGLYGYGFERPVRGRLIDPLPAMRPVMRWTSRLVHLKQVPAGVSIGYQRTFVTERPSRLGLVPVGHADGYPLALSNRGVVRVGRERRPAPVCGQVNMDQTIIDLTDVPGATIGDEVELVSNDPEAPNALPRLAQLAGSSCYELLCRLSPRTPRCYLSARRAVETGGRVAAV